MGMHEIKKTTEEMVSELKRPPTEWVKSFLALHQTRD
jgi:hypothetical protein